MLSIKNLIRVNPTHLKHLSPSKSLSVNFSQSTNVLKSNKVVLHDKYSDFTLPQLNNLSKELSKNILTSRNCSDLRGERIAVLCANNYTYLVSLMAIWKAGGVPLGINKNYPLNLIEYFLTDSNCKLVINGINPEEEVAKTGSLSSLLAKQKVVNYKVIENEYYKSSFANQVTEDEDSLEYFRGLLNKDLEKEALILYTSGTR